MIADIETGFNTKDPELSVAHFTDDGWAVGVSGVRTAGRAALLESHRAALAGPLRDQYARYRVGEVNLVRADVAIAQKYAAATDRDGRPLDLDHVMIALYVLVREGGCWRVAARQNTLVAAGRPSAAPVGWTGRPTGVVV